jgi:hypothetical protein
MNCWRRDPRVLARRSGETFALLCPDKRDLILLEGSAARLWEALDEAASDEELVGVLARTYGVPPGDVAAAIVSFLADLRDAGAVTRC